MKHKSTIMPSEEEVELEEEKDLLVKHKRAKFSGSIVQPQQGIEVSDTESKVPDVLSLKVSAGKDPRDGLTDCAVQISGEANGCSKGHVQHVTGISFTGNESARSRLPKICTAIGWKEPSYEFEEQGPPHNKLFTCKITVHVDGIVNTVMECFGDPKRQKKAAQEHAAQGALWCLERYGHAK
ncbi:endoribonuclease Dicer homolog 4-like [Phragmites australis]|uniref:endoribonuclease Dicer homolog 4-like n=1 Tax=Phragmites australis TaxID=29695 RepID=UPI002D7703A0|nr:endoribonuclease Dicer homolog 4-like [Phragmites australis]XP_062194033.1 endoribonuclease Dicer homolog 4-like [Phragmites australis]XP_062194034.1 endoribonuclease Dicer homolog 4-like [Phragmites australis]XP_062194035.1 endoribonuclease Dicer homolog 4-like [Phragmites australis]